MAGTLTISTLSDGTNSTSATNPIKGSCKAWSDTIATGGVNASYNFSSVTNTGTGLYTYTFTNAMTDANYAVTTGGFNANIMIRINSKSTTLFTVETATITSVPPTDANLRHFVMVSGN